VKLMANKQINFIDMIENEISINNDMDFVLWKDELNRGLQLFWESITEDLYD
jgi:hypothetical protein